MTLPVCSISAKRLRDLFLRGRPGILHLALEGEGEAARLHFYLTQEERKPKGGKLAAKAGMLCAEGGFQAFLGAAGSDEAARMLRERCGVESRAELDHDSAAAGKFVDLATEYEFWLRG